MVGLATYGYKIMRVIGVKAVKLSNVRGFSAELSTAIVVMVASRYGLPVSTTQVGTATSWLAAWSPSCMVIALSKPVLYPRSAAGPCQHAAKCAAHAACHCCCCCYCSTPCCVHGGAC